MPNIKALGLIVSDEDFQRFFCAKLECSGQGQFGPHGHNLKESERGPPKEHSCEIWNKLAQ